MDDPSHCFDFDELSSLIDISESSESMSISDYKFCEDCNVIMESDINNTLTWHACGFIKQISTEYYV